MSNYEPPQSQSRYWTMPGAATTAPAQNGVGVAGFVTGLLAMLLFWVSGIGAVLAVLAVVFSAVGNSARRRTAGSTGFAVAGLVLGILASVLALAVLSA